MNFNIRAKRLPGEAGIWVFILGDLVVFSLFFAVFLYYRDLDIELYRDSRQLLNPHYGMANTLLLLTSSWFVVMAVESYRCQLAARAARLFGGAILCGLGFSAIKVVEYTEKFGAGISITSNDFFMYYYIFTGLHFLHVLIGIGVLAVLAHKSRRLKIDLLSDAAHSDKSNLEIPVIESGASFWHLVDLLWIVLFPLLYLL